MIFPRHFIRWIVTLLCLVIATWVIPGFLLGGKLAIFILSLAITFIGYLMELLLGTELNPFTRGIIGSLSTFGTLLIFQWLSPYTVHLFGTLFVTLWIGVIDFFVPVHERYR